MMSQLETYSPVAWREKVDSCYEIVSRYLGALRHLQLLSSKRMIDAPEIKQVVDTLKLSQQSVSKFAELKALFEFSRKELDGLRAGRESPECVPMWEALYLHRTAIHYWISLGLPADSEVHEIDTAKLQEWAGLEKSCLLRDIEAFLRLHQIEEEEKDRGKETAIRKVYDSLSDKQQDELWHFFDFKTFKAEKKDKTTEFLLKRQDIAKNYDRNEFNKLVDRVRNSQICQTDNYLRRIRELRRKVLPKSFADD